jgi:hypothetical protein
MHRPNGAGWFVIGGMAISLIGLMVGISTAVHDGQSHPLVNTSFGCDDLAIQNSQSHGLKRWYTSCVSIADLPTVPTECLSNSTTYDCVCDSVNLQQQSKVCAILPRLPPHMQLTPWAVVLALFSAMILALFVVLAIYVCCKSGPGALTAELSLSEPSKV